MGWMDSLGQVGSAAMGVGSMGAGSVIGGLGAYLGKKWAGDMFDNTAKNQSQTLQGLEQGANLATRMAPGMTKASMYSAAGTAGPDVRQQYRDREMSLTSSAGAMKALADLDASKKGMLSQSGQQGRLAQMLAERQAGKLGRDTMGTVRAMGGSPASVASIGGQMAQGQQSGLLANLANASQMQQQALGNAANLTSQQEGIRTNDLNQRYNMYVKPYEAQVNGGIASLANTYGGSMADGTDLTKSGVNPFEGLASGLGQLGTYKLAGQAPTWMNLRGNDVQDNSNIV